MRPFSWLRRSSQGLESIALHSGLELWAGALPPGFSLCSPGDRAGPSPQDRVDRRAVVDGEAFAAGDLELVGIESERFKNGGVDVSDVVAIFDGVEAELVGGAVPHTHTHAHAHSFPALNSLSPVRCLLA